MNIKKGKCMKLLIKLLGICGIFFITYNSIDAQESIWKPVGPGGNGWYMFFSVHPAGGDLYVSSDMTLTLLRSTDKGESWEPIGNPVTGTGYFIAGDPNDPNIIYMNQISKVKEKSGIWKSTDKGDTWRQLYASEIFGKSRGQSGLVDPADGRILYWTTANMGVVISTDGGYSWNDYSDGLPISKIHQKRHLNALEMEFSSEQASKRKIYYPTNLGLFVKDGFDSKWKLIKSGLPESECNQVAVCSDGVIYAAFPLEGLYKSEDFGKSWTKLENGLDNKNPLRVVANKANSNIVYVAAVNDEGVYGSQDGGRSFKLLTHWKYNEELNWPMNYRQHESVSGMIMLIDPQDPNLVYLDYNKKTTDGGKTWHHFGMREVRRDRWTTTGLTLLTEYRVVFDPNRPGIVWLGFSDTGLMLSEDNGESIINVIPFHRGEVNQAAYWRDRLVNTSGSCQSMTVDPQLSTTIYASISMKSTSNRASAGGIVIKSVDGGWNWRPIYEKNGLDDGIIRSIVIDPSSPKFNRTVYVASFGNGVYKSIDDGNTFKNITPKEMFNGNTRLMWLEMAPSDPKTLYLGVGGSKGIRPITKGADAYPYLQPGMFGGIFKTTDSGNSWQKCNQTREIPNVQDLAVDPSDPNTVYAAAWNENFLLEPGKDNEDWAKGGLYKTTDGGINWELVFQSPVDDIHGIGEVSGVCINPVAPEIVYIIVENYGVYRSFDKGATWEMVGEKSMERMQRRYHSIDINPHNPAEIWVAHFGSSFSKTIDYKAKNYLEKKFLGSNFIKNPSFEALDDSGKLLLWKYEQPPAPEGEKEVISVSNDVVSDGKNSVNFYLTQAYTDAPSPYQADNAQRRLEAEGVIPVDTSWAKEWEVTGETRSWIYQNIDPYFVTLMRGKEIEIEMDVFIKERKLPTWWGRGYEAGEVPRRPPQIYVSEIRDYNIHWLVAETHIEELHLKPEEIKGRWLHVSSKGKITKDALGVRVTITGVGMYSGPMNIYVDNVRLSIVQ